MKQFWKDLAFSCIMGLIIPGMILSVGVAMFGKEVPETEPTVTQIVQLKEDPVIPVLTKQGVREMGLNEYLTGVVLAEMPASFEPEAHKAQAVVARTYTMRAHLGKSKHDQASVCTDSACCQGYISPEDYIAKGGTEVTIQKIRNAVLDTDAFVLTYDGELIEATYFSCSGGTTEDAVAVWGTDVPYLQSVASPGEEGATHYTDTVTFSSDEFKERLSIESGEEASHWIGKVTYTAGSGVDTILIAGKQFRGTEIRKLLGLRSTAFEIRWEHGTFTVTTRGYGHRVGMSQYGADAMAATGSGFEEILAHYYQGTKLEQMDD